MNNTPNNFSADAQKDAQRKALILAMRGYARDGGIRWNAKEDRLEIKNTRPLDAIPNPFNEMIDKVWAVVGVDGYDGDAATYVHYQGTNGRVFANILHEAGLPIENFTPEVAKQWKR